MASILRPKALRAGDLVVVTALSGGLEQPETPLFARGVEAIEQMGFAVHVSPLVDLDRGGGGRPPHRGSLPRSSMVSFEIHRYVRSSRSLVAE